MTPASENEYSMATSVSKTSCGNNARTSIDRIFFCGGFVTASDYPNERMWDKGMSVPPVRNQRGAD